MDYVTTNYIDCHDINQHQGPTDVYSSHINNVYLAISTRSQTQEYELIFVHIYTHENNLWITYVHMYTYVYISSGTFVRELPTQMRHKLVHKVFNRGLEVLGRNWAMLLLFFSRPGREIEKKDK